MQPPPRPKAAPSKEAIHAASIQTLSTASVPTQPKASATGTSQQKNGGGSGQSPDSGRDASSKPKQVTIDTSMNQRNSRNGGGDTVSTTSDLSADADGDSAGDNSGNNTPQQQQQQQQGVDGTSQPNGAAPVSILKNSVADVSVGDSVLTSSSPSSDGQGGAIQSRIGRKRKRKG